MAEKSDVFLLQKIEFLECELQEGKVREQNLKKLNDSLMSLVNKVDRSPLKEEAIEELKRVNEQYSTEMRELKRRANTQQDALTSQISQLKRRNKELEFAFKECEVVKEREKLELKERLRQLEADKQALQHSVQLLEEERSYIQIRKDEAKLKCDMDLKAYELQRQLEIQKEEATRDILKARETADASIGDFKALYEAESNSLRLQVSALLEKSSVQGSKVKKWKEIAHAAMKDRDSIESPVKEDFPTPKKHDQTMATSVSQLLLENTQLKQALRRFERSTELYQVQIKQLQQDLSLARSQGNDVNSLMQTLEGKDREIEELSQKLLGTSAHDLSFSSIRDDRPMRASPLSTTRTSDWKNFTTRTGLNKAQINTQLGHTKKDLTQRELHLLDLKLSLEGMHLQKEKAQIELDRVLLELKQNKMDWTMSDDQRGDNELGLKQEIKFLIGKLLRAKSKLRERDANEASFRSKSALRTRAGPVGMHRNISPFDT